MEGKVNTHGTEKEKLQVWQNVVGEGGDGGGGCGDGEGGGGGSVRISKRSEN